MISLFDKELLAMERDVRDLKTIHQRGVGSIVFYQFVKEFTLPANKWLDWTIELKNDEPSPALYTFQTNGGIYTADIIQSGEQKTGSISGGTSGRTRTIVITCSSDINVTTEIT